MSTRDYGSELRIQAGATTLEPSWAAQLDHGYVQTGTERPACAWLRFRDPGHRFLSATGITFGTRLTVSATTASRPRPVRLFTGEVTALRTDIDGTGTFTVIQALDRAHRLCRGRVVAAYAEVGIEEVLSQVARRAGLRAGTAEGPRSRFTHLTQPNVSDWDFLRALARQSGTRVVVDDSGTLSLRRPAPATGAPDPRRGGADGPDVLRAGVNLLSLRACLTSAGHAGRVEVRGWDVTGKKEVMGTARADGSKELALGTTPRRATSSFGDRTLTVTTMGVGTQADAESAAASLAASVAAGFAELEAVASFSPRLRAGTPVALAGIGEPFTGRYTPTEVRHVFDPLKGYQTWLSFGDGAPWPDPAQEAGGVEGHGSGQMPGLATAVVSNVKHPQLPDQGWVKLRLPWLGKNYETDWVRTVQAGGAGGGGMMLPEVGDEVLIGFEQGRLERPFVLGGLYNGKDKPSPDAKVPLVASSGKVNRRSLADRSGDRIDLLDAAEGDRGLRLETGDGKLTVFLDRQQTAITITSGGTVEIKAEGPLTLSGKGITLDAGGEELGLKAGSVRIEANSVDIQ
ncbi:VgrG-related protein [Streptomyces orinoci]|uniref:VgrG-related protein n=1 Tax=Streptomyces orinoci TaxID=67339 RepID=A0ABV3K1R9_STRON|nr:VgrG-related protein [Streptomyces orinoci]